MKSLLLHFVLITALCGLSHSQKLSLPSNREVDKYMTSRARVNNLVDCVIKYKPTTCEPRFKIASELASQYFAGQCHSCTKETLRWVGYVLRILQKKYRSEYMRLINSVVS